MRVTSSLIILALASLGLAGPLLSSRQSGSGLVDSVTDDIGTDIAGVAAPPSADSDSD